jgi:hypothetical protein
MKLDYFLLLLSALTTRCIAVSQNASFIAGEIALISPCGVRQLIELSDRRDVTNSGYR